VVPPATGPIRRLVSLASVLGAVLAASCGGAPPDGPSVVTFPGSMLGGEGTVLRTQLQRFMQENPGIRVIQRDTPDAADQRHQLYVQWLNAQASEPDIVATAPVAVLVLVFQRRIVQGLTAGAVKG
jgi:ABC-type glycerol-3-phosphate transport system substrate-binding protein